MSCNIFVWGVALGAHAACRNFAGLFVVRFLLGACEGSITAGFMIITSMFYTRNEQTVRVGWWYSPTTAWFLTEEERVNAVKRIKGNQAGVENKKFKKDQMIEAFLDPKTWLFALFAALDNVPSSFLNQRQIIVSSFGFTPLQTTLLGCVDGVIEIVTIFVGVTIAAKIANSRAYIAALFFVPDLIGVFLVNFLPWTNKVGLLFAVWTTELGTTAFVLVLAWVSSVTAGHTKKVTVNAILLSSYCIGNSVGPLMWQAKYKPRFRYTLASNHIPWAIMGACYFTCMLLVLILRFILDKENKRRDRETRDTTYDDVYMLHTKEDGCTEKIRIEKGVDESSQAICDQ
ncbi:hypothetical protein D9756_009992 [Leucocoprinus leucothites]|uniref:Uncharacterized protein n=1 Tax=Leucocoprinus leucothites TaxID=201217 RepID=A0A8H5CTE5_9AGAR|nr:hypothetical protein D9756_009992 [Leucoagaricus leucothites]